MSFASNGLQTILLYEKRLPITSSGRVQGRAGKGSAEKWHASACQRTSRSNFASSCRTARNAGTFKLPFAHSLPPAAPPTHDAPVALPALLPAPSLRLPRRRYYQRTLALRDWLHLATVAFVLLEAACGLALLLAATLSSAGQEAGSAASRRLHQAWLRNRRAALTCKSMHRLAVPLILILACAGAGGGGGAWLRAPLFSAALAAMQRPSLDVLLSVTLADLLRVRVQGCRGHQLALPPRALGCNMVDAFCSDYDVSDAALAVC